MQIVSRSHLHLAAIKGVWCFERVVWKPPPLSCYLPTTPAPGTTPMHSEHINYTTGDPNTALHPPYFNYIEGVEADIEKPQKRFIFEI